MRGLIVAAALIALMPTAAARAGPDPVNKPLRDGCQRNVPGLLTFSTPEWVRVDGTSATAPTRVVEGTTTLTHTADEDLPQSHTSYDLDSDVIPDPAYIDLLSGSPTSRNGNFAEDADYAKLHVEWESRALPAYAWPTEGDRVKLWGEWIWDCGHWGEGIETDQDNPEGSLVGTGDYLLPGQVEGDPPASLRGEQTELHPLQAVVVTRKEPWAAPAGESQTDVFVSNDGTHAYAEEKCAVDIAPLPEVPSYGPDWTACANTAANEQQPVRGHSYDFFVPAPPRPSPDAHLDYREIVRVTGSTATEQVTPRSDGLAVHVAFPNTGGGLAYGTTFLVGWTGGTAAASSAHLRLHLASVTVVKSLDPNFDRIRQTGAPPGEYNLYLDANGRWTFVGGRGPLAPADDSLAPGLGAVTDGQVVPVGDDVDFFVPSGAPVRLEFSGRECDLPKMDPCVANAEVSDGNDHPGHAIAQFPSPDAALGAHTLASDTGDYSVDYSVERLPDATGGASPPGTSGVDSSAPGGDLGGRGTLVAPVAGCSDTLAPQSRFGRHGVRSSRQRALTARGTAADRGCSGSVARVTLALAERVGGGRCRYMLATGRLGPRVGCRRPTYVSASGTSRWSLRSGARLPRGTYVVRSRAIDAAGNIERKHRLHGRARNFVTLRVR